MQNILNKSLKRIKYWIKGGNSLQHGQAEKDIQAVAPGSPVVLSAQVVWMQPFDTRPFDIDRISILFATFQRKNNCLVEICLFSKTHELLHHEALAADMLEDNVYHALNLPEDFTYKGECCLSIASPDATPTNCVAIWTTVDAGGAGLRELSRMERDVSTITPAMEGRRHLGVALETKLGRSSSNQAWRSYTRHSAGVVEPVESPEILGLVGFSLDEIEYLSSLSGLSQTELQAFEVGELDMLAQCKALLVSSTCDIELDRTLARFCRRRGIPMILVELGEVPVSPKSLDAWSAFADGVVSRVHQPTSRLPQAWFDDDFPGAVNEIVNAYKVRHQPKVSIVTIMSGKAEQHKWVIKSYFDQTYEGEIEVIYIHDCFGDAESSVAAEFASNSALPHAPRLGYTILRNERNVGNCASRNRGVAAASGDIIVIIDADCMLNRQFIAAHVDAHSYLDCEVVVGPHNIETNGVPPLDKLIELERVPAAALEESELQDPLNLDSFLNCITRNFSIKKPVVIEDLFDLDFSYSLSPETGFGWEDVEMGYRLYKRALGIKFTQDAFSVHISHDSSVPETVKPRKSIRNFHKLFLKHPELRDVARRWAVRTLDALDKWSVKVDPNHGKNQDLASLKLLFSDVPRCVDVAVARRRKLRILTYRWHVPHQYELYKSGHDFFLVKGTGSPMCDQWEFGHRPLPANANFINIEDVQESQFDLAILHFDENVLNYENTNGNIGPEWGAAFRYFVEHINLPKVAICHGTPQFHGQYTPDYNKPDLMVVIETARAALVDYVKDIEIVCNSHQAQREWGFHKSRVIWHGFDPSEFLPSSYTKGILSPLGPLVKSRPHYRGFYLYQKVFSPDFPAMFLPETLSVPDPDIDYVDNLFAIGKYKNYVDQIRKYSVYFNPTLRSPMPRARCEPMMCGVVTVNANNHDVDMFIKNGVNGFYSNDPAELREQLVYLMRNPAITRRMGEEARKTAINVFNHDRYLADWSALLFSVVN
jgi:glycosyltransferase involved in cell wall biosynthesis